MHSLSGSSNTSVAEVKLRVWTRVKVTHICGTVESYKSLRYEMRRTERNKLLCMLRGQ
jgi:hypothetical protein